MQESSLRQTTRTVRKYLLFFVIFIIVIIVLQVILDALPQNMNPSGGNGGDSATDLSSVAQLYKSPAPDEDLETLVPPDLENIPLSESSDPLFNVVDVLPEIPFTSVNIYKVEEPRERFGSEDIAKDIAENFGFNNEEGSKFSRNTANTELSWQDKSGSKQLTYSKTTFEWTYKNKNPSLSPPEADSSSFENTEESITAYYKEQVKSIVENLAMNRSQINFSFTEIDYLDQEDGNYINASSPSTAKYIKAKFFRSFDAISLKENPSSSEDAYSEDVSSEHAPAENNNTNKATLQDVLNGVRGDDLPVEKDSNKGLAVENDSDDNLANSSETYKGPIIAKSVKMDYLSAPMELIFKAKFKEQLSIENLVYFNFKDWKFQDGSDEAIAYKLISPQAAWEKVKQRKGGIRLLSDNRLDNPYKYGITPDQNVISFTAENTSFELAYLEPEDWTGYIYPIYIFRGQAKLASSGEEDSADFVIYVYAYEPIRA